MPEFVWNDLKIAVDEDGFIENPDCWNERVALALASTDGVTTLTEDHWKVINYLRDYHAKFGIAPMVRKLCKECGYTLQQVYEMFPSGPANGACKVAGLAKPTGCV